MKTRTTTDFETVLPRLVATYEAGRLVPFIGSGMSLRACTDWSTFISGLERAVPMEGMKPIGRSTPRDELIRRANNAVGALKAGAPGTFEQAVREALAPLKDPAIPEQTKALARMWWPLILSTNYDNCYEAAFHAQFGRSSHSLAVVGRGIEDCQRVLNSLSVAGRSLLWALQGYLAAPYSLAAPPDERVAAELRKLQEQLVVGYEEYRRVTYRDLHFRRAFAEVFRQRSLLFVGSGIQETYLQELFGEVLEYYGPGTRPHYALIQKDEVDPEFMLARFQIIAIEYGRKRHEKVAEWLNRLADATSLPRRAPVKWSWGRITRKQGSAWTSTPDLEVIRGPLPMRPVKGECLAVSAAGGSHFFFAEGVRDAMEAWGVQPNEQPQKSSSRYLGVFRGRDVYAVRARSGADKRSLLHVYDAALRLFQEVAKSYRCIHMQLLAAGAPDTTEAQANVRIYPERFSFVQIVRAWATWRKQNPAVGCRLALYILSDSVYQDIASGRIDVLELLSCTDIRFFVEILAQTGELERRLFQSMPGETLKSLVDRLGLSPRHWTLEVTPPPSLNPQPPLRKRLSLTLQQLGIVPGSTLHFRRV